MSLIIILVLGAIAFTSLLDDDSKENNNDNDKDI